MTKVNLVIFLDLTECKAWSQTLEKQQQPFNNLWSGTTRVGWYQKKQLLWIFMEQGRIMVAEAPTVRVGATPAGLTAPTPPQPLQGFLQAGCPSCRPINSVKALKAKKLIEKGLYNMLLCQKLHFQLRQMILVNLSLSNNNHCQWHPRIT